MARYARGSFMVSPYWERPKSCGESNHGRSQDGVEQQQGTAGFTAKTVAPISQHRIRYAAVRMLITVREWERYRVGCQCCIWPNFRTLDYIWVLTYFGTPNDTAPPSHMPSDRISRRRKSAPSSSMVNASGLISAALPGFGGLHGLGDKLRRSRLARSLGWSWTVVLLARTSMPVIPSTYRQG